MPIMIRPSKKAQRILNNILGIPVAMVKTRLNEKQQRIKEMLRVESNRISRSY